MESRAPEIPRVQLASSRIGVDQRNQQKRLADILCLLSAQPDLSGSCEVQIRSLFACIPFPGLTFLATVSYPLF